MQEHRSVQPISVRDDASCVDIQRMSLESAIRQAAEAIVITSATGKIQYVNPAFTKMTGYHADEVIGHYPNVLKSGVQDPAYYEDLWKTITSGSVWRGELINRRQDGTLYTEEMSITPVLSGVGRISSYIAIKQDVTARRAAERAQQFLAAIVESTDEAVVGSDLDGKIVTWNRAAEKLHGYPAQEAIGQSIMILLAPEYHVQTRRISEGLVRGKTYPQFECMALRKNGDRVPVSVTVSLIRNAAGQATGQAAIIRDITRYKQAEKVLRDSEARFRMAFENAPFGLCIAAADTSLLQANGTFCRMLGYDAAELNALGWPAVTHPDDRKRCEQAYEQLLRDPSAHIELEKRYLHKAGHTVPARLKISLMDVDGTVQFVVHVEERARVPAQ